MIDRRPAHAVLALAGAALLALGALVLAGESARVLALGAFFGLMAALAITDWRTETVPDALTLLLVFLGLATTALINGPFLVHAVCAVSFLVIGFSVGRFTSDEGWIGSGDYFLLAGILAWFGPLGALEIALLASLIVIATCILVRRRRAALAPALALSAALILIGGNVS